MRRTILLTLTLLLLTASTAMSFDFEQYEKGDLDVILTDTTWLEHNKENPSTITLCAPQKLVSEIRLATKPYACRTAAITMAMSMLGVPKEVIDEVPITHCVDVYTKGGKTAKLAIQDSLAPYLLDEVKVNQTFYIYCDYLSWSMDGPGILINEFQTQKP